MGGKKDKDTTASFLDDDDEMQGQAGEGEAERPSTAEEAAAADAAEAAPDPEPAPAAEPAREFAEIEEPVELDELLNKIEDAETVELALVGSNGVELPIEPRTVDRSEEPWALDATGLRPLLTKWEVNPPAEGPSMVLEGYALILDGKHVANAKCSAPLTLGGGITYNLTDDVLFV